MNRVKTVVSASLRSSADRAIRIALDILMKPELAKRHIITQKGRRDYAIERDFQIEDAVRKHFKHATPSIPMLGEERGGTDISQAVFWTLDPIDGTVNYSRRMPLCGISLALVVQGKADLAMVELPFMRESYRAERGMGATLNGHVIRVSNVGALSQAIVAVGDFGVGIAAERENRIQHRILESVSDRVLRVRMYGSAAVDLAWLAAGRVDASITLNNNAWDVQAGALLVREAGGSVVDIDGEEHTVFSKWTLAGNDRLKRRVLKIVQLAKRDHLLI